jgi:hypothetical protein
MLEQIEKRSNNDTLSDKLVTSKKKSLWIGIVWLSIIVNNWGFSNAYRPDYRDKELQDLMVSWIDENDFSVIVLQ